MADFEVLWTDEARLDLRRIAAFIAEESPALARAVVDKVEHRCHALVAFPERGRVVPELRALDVLVYRELVEGPWRIVYRYEAGRVYVTAVLDARRDLSSLLLERLVR